MRDRRNEDAVGETAPVPADPDGLGGGDGCGGRGVEIWLEFAFLFLHELAAEIGEDLGHLAAVAEDGEDGVFIQGGLDGDEALGERLVIGIDDGVDDILLADILHSAELAGAFAEGEFMTGEAEGFAVGEYGVAILDRPRNEGFFVGLDLGIQFVESDGESEVGGLDRFVAGGLQLVAVDDDGGGHHSECGGIFAGDDGRAFEGLQEFRFLCHVGGSLVGD